MSENWFWQQRGHFFICGLHERGNWLCKPILSQIPQVTLINRHWAGTQTALQI